MDISAIARLTNLNTLILDNNFISDLSPLVENTELKWVYVNENPPELPIPSTPTFPPSRAEGLTLSLTTS